MSILDRIYSKFTDQYWNIGIIDNSLEDVINNIPIKIRMLRHRYKEGWFADPFILDVSDSFIWLLVEELYFKNDRGRISKLTIDKKRFELLKVEPVLELDSHLSFPAIFRENNNIYIYPENAKGLGLAMYEYDPLTNKCEFIKIISKRKLADAIITNVFGEDVIWATEMPTHNGCILNEYSLMKEGDVVLKYQYAFDENVARNAGDWFKLNERVFRPAQDCNMNYGKAVVLQEVIKTTEGFDFKEIRRIESTLWNYTTGCHTFNQFKDVIIIDCHGYKYPILGPIVKKCFPKCFLK
ncbi:hypothetical protein [uncultured Prevotella sp.]|uniref:glucosamine inositolphosphorylceramide transferase family protein n=1 Tax=uncultured Prevotella sp. TaxID=159272 RepID=UPI0025895FA5|nr:hypothetical protein [uncultured Prevotella sp.]